MKNGTFKKCNPLDHYVYKTTGYDFIDVETSLKYSSMFEETKKFVLSMRSFLNDNLNNNLNKLSHTEYIRSSM